MAGYWLVRTGDIEDQEAFQEYAAQWGPIAEKYGARVIAGKGENDYREGPQFSRLLVVEFPSYAQAQACYDDQDYQLALPLAKRAYVRELVIAEG